MLLFILLKRVETAADPPPAHWVGQIHGICLKWNLWVVFSCPGSVVVGVCLVVCGCFFPAPHNSLCQDSLWI